MALKKIKPEYLILIIAWIFWGFSNSIIWIQQVNEPNYKMILSIKLVQTINCILYNLAAIYLMLIVIRKVKYIKRRYLYFSLIIVFISLLLVLTNVTTFNLIRGIWKENVEVFTELSNYIVNTTEKIIYLSGYCTMFFLIRNWKELQKQKTIAEEAQQQARDAQLQLLQQQLSPHFLFNTLNSLRSLITIDTDRARNMVTDLSDFLRVTLSSYKSVQNTIADEINLIEYYLKIQKVRFESDLIYTIKVDKELNSFLVPKFIIQPLVENALKYGMQTSKMPLEISISVIMSDKKVMIEVKNSGLLIDTTPESYSQHGLINTSKRLELMFPKKTNLKLNADNNHVVCNISIDL